MRWIQHLQAILKVIHVVTKLFTLDFYSLTFPTRYATVHYEIKEVWLVVTEREKIIQQIRDYFAHTDVRRVSLFGSFARDEIDTVSDVDLLMEVDEPIGYLKIIEYKLALEKSLKRKVDLLTPEGISPKIRSYIQKELQLIYENPG